MRSLRTWDEPRAQTRGLLAHVLRSENLHHRHALACGETKELTMGMNLQCTVPFRAFAPRVFRTAGIRQSQHNLGVLKQALNRDLTPTSMLSRCSVIGRDRGVVKCLEFRLPSERRPSHAQIFFWRRRFWAFKRNQKVKKTRHLNDDHRRQRFRHAIYFPGACQSFRDWKRDRRSRQDRVSINRKIHSARRAALSEKTPRNSVGGG